jgi:hypothetical protein
MSLSALLSAGTPIVLGREQAQQLAQQELQDHAYQQESQPWVMRLIGWLLGRFTDLLNQVGGASPGGWIGIICIVILIVGLTGVVRWRMGPLRRRAGSTALFDQIGSATTASATHRRAAERAAADGRWADAVRERLRAIVRDLEERGLLDPRAGRTAEEAALEGGQSLPTVAADLLWGAHTFGNIWYGGRTADEAAYQRLVGVDDAVIRARRAPGTETITASPDRFTAVPR